MLEGDKPSAPSPSGPGKRYTLGPTPPLEKLEAEGELPEAYGTGHLMLAARDPHWLYSHWDFTPEQQRHYNRLSMHRHLTIRLYIGAVSTRPIDEVHVHPESRHWFIHAARAGTTYVAEIGYYTAPGKWVAVSVSGPTFTPPETLSEDTSAEFATIPFELPMANLLTLVKEAVEENLPLAEALREMREQGHAELPAFQPPPGRPAPPPAPAHSASAETFHRRAAHSAKPRPWTPEQEKALAEIVSMDRVRRVWMGSLEITELIRRQAERQHAAIEAAKLAGLPGAPTSPAQPFAGGPTSPGAPGAIQAKAGKGFWFHVNAELVIYGGTEPDAMVTIGGRQIRLRKDGTFSYRFALPDGEFELPIVAVSADGTDGRGAEMNFKRATEYRGDVGASPQDATLKQPRPESV